MSEIREAPRELLALAVAMREDWDRDETWDALLAARNAGWPWDRVLAETVRLLRSPDSAPRDLRRAAADPVRREAGTDPGSVPEVAALRRQLAAMPPLPEHRNGNPGGTAA